MSKTFYKDTRWIRKRASILRRDEYMCRQCKRYGKTTAATTVHHVHPLDQRPDLALVSVNLISMCNKCHDGMHDRNSRELTALGREWIDRVSPHLSNKNI
jgi:5-methylcytosine-specific restriction protein A